MIEKTTNFTHKLAFAIDDLREITLFAPATSEAESILQILSRYRTDHTEREMQLIAKFSGVDRVHLDALDIDDFRSLADALPGIIKGLQESLTAEAKASPSETTVQLNETWLGKSYVVLRKPNTAQISRIAEIQGKFGDTGIAAAIGVISVLTGASKQDVGELDIQDLYNISEVAAGIVERAYAAMPKPPASARFL